MRTIILSTHLFLFALITNASDVIKKFESPTENSKTNNEDFYSIGTKLYFNANDGIHGEELWCFDSETNKTYLVADIIEGESGGEISLLGEIKGKLVFKYGLDLYITDGTEKNTTYLNSIGSNLIEKSINLTDEVYFTTLKYGGYSSDLWMTDGTVEKTKKISTLVLGSSLLEFNTSIFFAVKDSVSEGNFMFVKYSPQKQTTEKIVDTQSLNIIAGNAGNFIIEKVGSSLDGIFISANTGNRRDLFFTKGDGKTIHLMADAGSLLFFPKNNIMYFGRNPFNWEQELWLSDGTIEGTKLLKAFEDDNSHVTGISFISYLNDKVIFHAETAEWGIEPWVSDGTMEGTILLKDFTEGADSYSLMHSNKLFHFNNLLYFYGDNALWKTDGTPLGTKLVEGIKDIEVVSKMHSFEGNIYFYSPGVNIGIEPHFLSLDFDLQLLKDINLTQKHKIRVSEIKIIDSNLYIGTQSERERGEIWTYDASNDSCFLIHDDAFTPNSFIILNDKLFFRDGGSWSNTLRTLDLIDKRIYSLATSGRQVLYCYNPTLFNNKIYFSTNNYQDPSQDRIWKTDGSPENTEAVTDEELNIEEDYYGSFEVASNSLFFSGKNVYSDQNYLWRLDTQNKSYKVNIEGAKISTWYFPVYSHFTPYLNSLVFVLRTDASEGNLRATKDQLWITDGIESNIIYAPEKGTDEWKNNYLDDILAIQNELLFINGSSQRFELKSYNKSINKTTTIKKFIYNPSSEINSPKIFKLDLNKIILTFNDSIWIYSENDHTIKFLNKISDISYLEAAHYFDSSIYLVAKKRFGEYAILSINENEIRSLIEFEVYHDLHIVFDKNTAYYVSEDENGNDMINKINLPKHQVNDAITGLNINHNELKELWVYPNPTTNELLIDYKGSNSLSQIKVINNQGIKILDQNISNLNTLNLSNLKAGIYILQFIDKSGKTFTRKIVKE